MGTEIKVVATGVIALCLALSAMLSMSSVAYQALHEDADRFLVLGVFLIAIVIVLSIVKVRVRLI
jgi:hypothetical protein